MTLRERIADWISGGALSRARADVDRHFESHKENVLSLCRSIEAVRYQRNHYSNALSRIAAMETPSANATVRRMAAAAREALE